MYRILVEGSTVQITDKPLFVTFNSPNGCPQPCKYEHADALSVRGTLYNIYGREAKVEGAPVALWKEEDTAELLGRVEETTNTNNSDIAANKVDVENMLLELDMMYSDQMLNIENAILDMDIAAQSGTTA